MKSFRGVCGSMENIPIIQYLATISGLLAIVSSGMHYGWPAPSLPILLRDNSTLPVTDDEGSWLAVMPLVGSVFGCIFGIFILNAIGRKTVTLVALFPFFMAWIMVAFAKSVPLLMVARFLAGMSDSLLFASIPMYLSEIADARIRGLLGSSVSVGWIVGTLLINLIGSYLTIRNAALVSAIVPVVCFVSFCWMPESPYYLMMKNNSEAARRSLKILKRTQEVESDVQRISNGIKEQNANGGSWYELFTIRSNRKAFLITICVRAIQQLSGSSAITFYAQMIFQESNDIMSPTTATTIYFAIQVILCGCSSLIVDKTGRKPLLIISIIGTGLALCTQGIYFYISSETNLNTSSCSWIPLVTLILYVIMYSIGLHTIPILLLGELFPTNIKGFALSLAEVAFAISVTVVSKFFQITKDNYGMHVPFFSFTLCCVFGLFFFVFCVPETKGKTLEEIQLALKGGETVVNEGSQV